MNKKKNAIHQLISSSFLGLILGYLIIILLLGTAACYFSYRQRHSEAISSMQATSEQLAQDYSYTQNEFWQIYLPIFESNSGVEESLYEYYHTDAKEELSPFARNDLTTALKQMLLRDSRIEWLGVYNPERRTNYMIYKNVDTLSVIPADFPWLDELKWQTQQMVIYGTNQINSETSPVNTYLVSGGIPAQMGKGRIIAGYSLESFEKIYQNSENPLSSLTYYLSLEDQVLYTSAANYPVSLQTNSARAGETQIDKAYTSVETFVVSFRYQTRELFLYSHKLTPLILLVIFIFLLASLYLYALMLRRIGQEVSVIQDGLSALGENQLDYRIPTSFTQNSLVEVAGSINDMARRLDENINRAYYYELRQKEAELAELQAKFNPHFLYNSLEMIRARCVLGGDDKTAHLVSQLATIFRGFIGAQTFIPFHEELSFTKRYLKLFGARYDDQVQIRFDIDSEILQYGVIRNIFQPLIENYFVHGFDSSEGDNNYIYFHGKSLDDKTILLTVRDNGNGMNDQELARLNTRLSESLNSDQESYGLKNLQQRLLLFYGAGYGLTIKHNNSKGLQIEMIILKMTCEAYETGNKEKRTNRSLY